MLITLRIWMVFIVLFTFLSSAIIVMQPLNENGIESPLGSASAETEPRGTDLELYWQFEHDTSSTYVMHAFHEIIDCTGDTSSSGKLGGGATYVDTTLFGKAIRFDGNDDWITVAYPTFMYTPNKFTIEFWFYRVEDHAGASYETVHTVNNVLVAQASGNQRNDNLEIGTDGQDVEVYMDSTYGESTQSFDCDIENNKWYNLALSYDGSGSLGSTELYINGVLKRTWNCWRGNLISSQGAPLSFGISRTDNQRYGDFNGIIDEVKIWSDAKTPADGLGACVLKMGFEERGGGSADQDNTYDRSVFEHVGTIEGCQWMEGTGIAPSFDSRCLSLGTYGDSVVVPDSNELDPEGPLTVEAWICADQDSDTYDCIVDKLDISSQSGYRLGLYQGNLRFGIGGGGSSTLATGTQNLRDNTWHRVTGVYDGSNIRVYVDGVQEGITATCNQDPAPNSIDLRIGSRKAGIYYYETFEGKIDDVRVYNYAKKSIGTEVLLLPFEEGSGFTTNDKSAFTQFTTGEGTLTNTPTWDPSWFGDYSLKFNGIDEYLYFNHSNQLDLTGDFTLESWIKCTSTSALQPIIDKMDTGASPDNGYSLYLDNGVLHCTVDSTTASGGTDLRDSDWHHVAGVYDGYEIRIYVDCRLKGRTPTTDNPDSNAFSLRIAKDHVLPNSFFGGKIDNVIISNYAKTFNEDIDGDGMSERYELLRSKCKQQFSSIEYNGRYAFLLAGGWDSSKNYAKYWNDMCFMYDNLRVRGYNDNDIFAVYGDGYIPNSYNCPDPSNKVSHSDFIDYAAREIHIKPIFKDILGSYTSYSTNQVNNMVTDRDTLLIWTSGNGGQSSVPHIILWDEDGDGVKDPEDKLEDAEFTSTSQYYLNEIQNYRRIIVTMGHNYAGGFMYDVASLLTGDHVFISSCNMEKTQQCDVEGEYCEFLYHFGGAHYWLTPVEATTTSHIDADADNNIAVSIYEAFDYGENTLSPSNTSPQLDDNDSGTYTPTDGTTSSLSAKSYL